MPTSFRGEEPLLAVQELLPGAALLAARRIHVGDPGLNDRNRPRLLLEHDLSVSDVDAIRAVARIAAQAVAAPADAVPAPLRSVRVFRVTTTVFHAQAACLAGGSFCPLAVRPGRRGSVSSAGTRRS